MINYLFLYLRSWNAVKATRNRLKLFLLLGRLIDCQIECHFS